ncbi:hypothetical protein [Brachybacterium sp. p3-SID957]|uniref:hypothetical protein n=1 Tax=Brachybacterium sp. p3-SID957 TaxID=2916049 RepID=UPI00223BEE9D|nr:hypothetical protein [Brachybacterium sp. p3-SID957]MCT1774955.1 hypothetical protein [Brachybacterium sp. p3-SID957]
MNSSIADRSLRLQGTLLVGAILIAGLAACGPHEPVQNTSGGDDAPSLATETTPATSTTAVESVQEETQERTDLTVFIREQEPLGVFMQEELLCKPRSATHEGIMDRAPEPRIRLTDENGEVLATQEVSAEGPILGGECTIFVKFLEVPVTSNYTATFISDDPERELIEISSTIDFDRAKFEDGYTQGIYIDIP